MTPPPVQIEIDPQSGCDALSYIDKNFVQPFSENGNVEIEPRTIKSVGIEHLSDVVEHQITTILGSTSHMVRFINGGRLEFAYNSEGKLIELNSRNLAVKITRDGEILFLIPIVQTA